MKINKFFGIMFCVHNSLAELWADVRLMCTGWTRLNSMNILVNVPIYSTAFFLSHFYWMDCEIGIYKKKQNPTINAICSASNVKWVNTWVIECMRDAWVTDWRTTRPKQWHCIKIRIRTLEQIEFNRVRGISHTHEAHTQTRNQHKRMN